jgi:hypothetical protein
MRNVPWAGLIAILLMFVLPARLFEGPRTVRHRPTRHVCADCGAPWVTGHTCPIDLEASADASNVVVPHLDGPLRAELRRLDRPRELHRRSARRLRRRSS